jgi:hypothetical protein
MMYSKHRIFADFDQNTVKLNEIHSDCLKLATNGGQSNGV